jgi:hypothetical protein
MSSLNLVLVNLVWPEPWKEFQMLPLYKKKETPFYIEITDTLTLLIDN